MLIKGITSVVGISYSANNGSQKLVYSDSSPMFTIVNYTKCLDNKQLFVVYSMSKCFNYFSPYLIVSQILVHASNKTLTI